MKSLCEYDVFGYHSRETVLGRKKVPYQLGNAEAPRSSAGQVRSIRRLPNPLGITSSIPAGKRGRAAQNLTYRLLQRAIIASKICRASGKFLLTNQHPAEISSQVKLDRSQVLRPGLWGTRCKSRGTLKSRPISKGTNTDL